MDSSYIELLDRYSLPLVLAFVISNALLIFLTIQLIMPLLTPLAILLWDLLLYHLIYHRRWLRFLISEEPSSRKQK